MASHCCAGLLPIPCCARQHDSVAHLSTTCQPAVAECPHTAQSASTGAVGATYSTVEPMGSPTSRPASLSRRTLLRHSSFVRAVCVDALVRICAGGRSAMVVPTATWPDLKVRSSLERPQKRCQLNRSGPAPAGDCRLADRSRWSCNSAAFHIDIKTLQIKNGWPE